MSTGAAAALSGGQGGASGAGAAPAGASGGAPAGASAVPAANGTGAGATGGAAQGAGSAGAQPGMVTDWTTSLNDDHRGFVQNKAWKTPTDILDSYRSLEKLVGAPPDQIIKLPQGDDPAGMDSVYSRLGRPPTPEGYKLDTPKDGGDPNFTKLMADTFYKNGLNEKQAKNLVETLSEFQKSQGAAQKDAYAVKIKSEIDGLKKEWGAAYEQNLSVAKRAAREFGVEPAVIDAIEKTAGYGGVMKLFNSIGSKIGDAPFVSGNPAGGGNGPMTPQQARDRIKALQGDPSFVKNYVAGGLAEKQQMEILHKYANPDSQ